MIYYFRKIFTTLFLIINVLSVNIAQQGAQVEIENIFYDKNWKEVFRLPRGHVLEEKHLDLDYDITDPLFAKYKENGFVVFDKLKSQMYAIDRFGKRIAEVKRKNINEIPKTKTNQIHVKDETADFGRPKMLKIGKIYTLEINGEPNDIVLKDNKEKRLFACKNCNFKAILGENNFAVSNSSFNPMTLQTFDTIRVFSIKDKKIVIENHDIRDIYFANGSIISRQLKTPQSYFVGDQYVVYNLQGKIIFKTPENCLRHHFNSKNDVLSLDNKTRSELENVSLNLRDDTKNEIITYFKNAKKLNLQLEEKEKIPSNLVMLKQLEELKIKETYDHENIREILSQLPKLQSLTLRLNSFEELNDLIPNLPEIKEIILLVSKLKMDKSFNKKWDELKSRFPNILFEIEIDNNFFGKPGSAGGSGRGTSNSNSNKKN